MSDALFVLLIAAATLSGLVAVWRWHTRPVHTFGPNYRSFLDSLRRIENPNNSTRALGVNEEIFQISDGRVIRLQDEMGVDHTVLWGLAWQITGQRNFTLWKFSEIFELPIDVLAKIDKASESTPGYDKRIRNDLVEALGLSDIPLAKVA